MKVLFNDGLSIKTFCNGKIDEYTCDFHENYIENARRVAKSSEWKTSGQGARFMGVNQTEVDVEKGDVSYFNSLEFLSPDKIIYSITVNGLSGVLTKDFTLKKDSEGHIIHSREFIFNGTNLDADGRTFATCVKNNYINSHLAVYDLACDDYTIITDGDCADFDAGFSKKNSSIIYFASKGVGRDGNGEFVKFSPSSIFSYNTQNGQLDEVLSDSSSLVKPKEDSSGNLYYIVKPERVEKGGFFGILLDIILLPWRLLKAIYNFLELFTMSFTGKGFSKRSNNPAKTIDKSQKQLFIEDNLINVEQEYKNNLKHKDNFAGIAPWDWKLVKRSPNGTVTNIANGVIDYCLLSDGGVIYTNGRHVLKISPDGKREKIADVNLCTKVAVCENA